MKNKYKNRKIINVKQKNVKGFDFDKNFCDQSYIRRISLSTSYKPNI